MSYERSLTFNLRVRGLSEVEIAEVLDEVRAHEAATGTAAEVEFGTAQEYAKQFPKHAGKNHHDKQHSPGGGLCSAREQPLMFGRTATRATAPITEIPSA